MFIERILSLFGGKLRRWIKTRESRDPEHLRFQLEHDEILDPLALQEQLRALLVNRGAKLVFLRKKNRVRLRRKSEAEIVEQGVKPAGLFTIRSGGCLVYRRPNAGLQLFQALEPVHVTLY